MRRRLRHGHAPVSSARVRLRHREARAVTPPPLFPDCMVFVLLRSHPAYPSQTARCVRRMRGLGRLFALGLLSPPASGDLLAFSRLPRVRRGIAARPPRVPLTMAALSSLDSR